MTLSKKRNKERMQRIRSVQPVCNLSDDDVVQPNTMAVKTPDVRPKPLNIPGLRMEGNRILGTTQKRRTTIDIQPLNHLPLYNPMVHEPGDRVLVKLNNRLVPVTIPELDADGHPVPSYWQ